MVAPAAVGDGPRAVPAVRPRGRKQPLRDDAAAGDARVRTPSRPRFGRRTWNRESVARQRQVRVEQKSALAAMRRLEPRSDEELEAEPPYEAAAQAILGA